MGLTSESDLESVFSCIEEPKSSAGKYVCSIKGCGQEFRRNVHLDRHEFKHTGIRKYKCSYPECTKSYTIITHLKRHLKVSHEKVEKTKDVKCQFDFCDKLFGSVYSMERHVREVHNNPKIYYCSHCGEKFTQKLKLRRHEVKHTGVYPYNCDVCSKSFVLEYHLNRHICKSYQCDQCPTSFEKWSELMAHRKSHPKALHKCDKCTKEYLTKFELAYHKNSHEDDKEVFPCPHEGCTRFYSYRRNLHEHLRVAHEGLRFPCTVEGCKTELSCKKALENHIKKIHSGTARVVKPPKKSRAKRKDAGKPIQSTLARLSGVVLDKKVDKMVRDGTAEIQIDSSAIIEEQENAVTGAEDYGAEEDHHVVVLSLAKV